MRYVYRRPVAEAHLVEWNKDDRPGIYDPDRGRPSMFMSSLRLHPDLVAWLEKNATRSSFISYDNGAGEDETCRLEVPSEAIADAFIERADAMSRAWVEADRATMRCRFVVETSDGPVEIHRSHEIPYDVPSYHEIERHFVVDRQPMRMHFFQAARKAMREVGDRPDDGIYVRVQVPIGPEGLRTPGARLVIFRLASPGSAASAD